MHQFPAIPLALLRSLTVLNGLAVALILAAVLVFGRDWPQAITSLLDVLAGARP